MSKVKPLTDITQSKLKDLFEYRVETGLFIRLKTLGGKLAGSVAGTVHSGGYIRITIDHKTYAAHRLAWLYVYGKHPTGELDHINGDPSDNRIENLREVTPRQNSRNRKVRKDNRVGHIGIRQEREGGKFMARIHVKGKEKYLGSFEKLEDAISARDKANRKYNYHENHGKR